MARYTHLQEPIEVGGLRARNQVIMTTHGPRLTQARYVRYLEERAKGGIGLADFNLGPMGSMQFPLGPGRPFPSHAGAVDTVRYHPFTADGRAFYDGMIPALREQSDAVKRYGVLSIALFSSRRRPTYRHVLAGGWAVGRSRRVRAPCTARSHRRGNR